MFYMGAAQIAHIAAKLIEHGLPAAQPVALLERATWPDERVLKSTLGQLPAMAAVAQLRSPTLLVVGEVAALAQAKDWIGSTVAKAAGAGD